MKGSVVDLVQVRPAGARWRAANLAHVSNGPGLRERADLTADGNVFFTYGDGRLAAGSRAGRGAVYGTLIRVAGIVPD